MKIIDFHTHFYPEKIRMRAMTAASGIIKGVTDGSRRGLEQSMAEAGISLSVLLPIVTRPENSLSVNAFAAAEKHGSICPLGSVHPADAKFEDTLKFAVDHGFRGLKLHPQYQDFSFENEAFFPVWEKCIEYGLFIITHAGYDAMFAPPFRTDPGKLRDFHRRFPELTLVAAHCGSMRMWDAVESGLAGEEVYFDLAFAIPSEIPAEQLKRIIRKHGADRILFGTDSPWTSQRESVDFIRSLNLDEAEEELIFHRNAEKLLGL